LPLAARTIDQLG